MARFCGEKETESKFKAAQIWKKKCLLALNSVFSDAAIWTKDNIEALNEDRTTGLIDPVLTLNGDSVEITGTISYDHYLIY